MKPVSKSSSTKTRCGLLTAYFQSASKIAATLNSTGFEKILSKELEDKELSFQGPASDDVVQAWEDRLERMEGFKIFIESSFNNFKKDFLKTLKSDEHLSKCKVYFFLARLIK